MWLKGWIMMLWSRRKRAPPPFKPRVIVLLPWLVSTLLLLLQMHSFCTECVHAVKICGCMLGFISPKHLAIGGVMSPHVIAGLGYPSCSYPGVIIFMTHLLLIHPGSWGILSRGGTFLTNWQIGSWVNDFVTGMNSRKGNLRVDYNNSLFIEVRAFRSVAFNLTETEKFQTYRRWQVLLHTPFLSVQGHL